MAPDARTAGDFGDPMSDKLLGVAADVLRSFGSAFGGRHLAIIGGAVPSLLAPALAPGLEPHVGTGDLDLHLSLHLMDGETADYYQAIVDGLGKLGLRHANEGTRDLKWRWEGTFREVSLRVELLCPTRTRPGRPERPAEGTPAEANIGDAGQISALALRFGHLVVFDTVIIERRVNTARGYLAYPFPVAGITSWLCLKADAIALRDKPKDAYDVVWLLDAIGPNVAAATVAQSDVVGSEHREDVVGQLRRLVEDQFLDDASAGPIQYARFLEPAPSEQNVRHASGTVQEFGNELRSHGILP